MPIYEFYCSGCNTLLNFFSARVDTSTRPECPHCRKAELERRPARFATLKSRGGEQDEMGEMGLSDEGRLEGAMEAVLGEMGEQGDSEDPSQLAHLFRRFGEAAGFEPGPKMEEMLQRLEAGEDPDRLEEEIGDSFDEEDSLEDLFRLKRGAAGGRSRRPRIDETLYFL